MKRYLLLASVAGCLLNAGNAMADYSTVDGDTATIAAKVTISGTCRFDYPQDINFGTVVVAGMPHNDIYLTMDHSGVVTYDEETVADSSLGRVYVSCPADVTASIDLSTGEASDGISFSNPFVVDSSREVVTTISGTGSSGDPSGMALYFGGDIEFDKDSITATEVEHHNDAALTVTLQY